MFSFSLLCASNKPIKWYGCHAQWLYSVVTKLKLLNGDGTVSYHSSCRGVVGYTISTRLGVIYNDIFVVCKTKKELLSSR
jgi:hypothetical protein